MPIEFLSLGFVQNYCKQTICSTVKGKKSSIYNRIGAEGPNSSDRGYYSFSAANTIPGAFHLLVVSCVAELCSVHLFSCENTTVHSDTLFIIYCATSCTP